MSIKNKRKLIIKIDTSQDSRKLRHYQERAIDAIEESLKTESKCLIKMFCGTGKSLVMRKIKYLNCLTVNLIVYVFPRLELIKQFTRDYLFNYPKQNRLNISSDRL